MKKMMTMVLLVAIAAAAQAENKSVVRRDTIIDCGRDGYYRDVRGYNAKGQYIDLMHDVYRRGKWEPNMHTVFEFDSRGNQYKGNHYGLEDGKWVLNSRFTSDYDQQHNEIRQLYEIVQDGQWQNWILCTMERDSAGHCKLFQRSAWNDSAKVWQIDAQEVTEYDEEGRLTERVYSSLEDGELQNRAREERFYAPAALSGWGYETTAEYRWRDGQWVGKRRYEVFLCTDCDGDQAGIVRRTWRWEDGEWMENEKK